MASRKKPSNNASAKILATSAVENVRPASSVSGSAIVATVEHQVSHHALSATKNKIEVLHKIRREYLKSNNHAVVSKSLFMQHGKLSVGRQRPGPSAKGQGTRRLPLLFGEHARRNVSALSTLSPVMAHARFLNRMSGFEKKLEVCCTWHSKSENTRALLARASMFE